MAAPLIIIGAGHAGGRASEWLRKVGYEEEILLIGAENDPPYERPPLSKGLLTGDKARGDCLLQSEGFYQDNRIELCLGEAVSAINRRDGTVETADGRHRFSKLILATGASPRSLNLPGSGLNNIFILRDLLDSERLRSALSAGKRLVVIGGGFIGLEVAASARKLGCDVVVLEASPRILARSLPNAAAKDILALHQTSGVAIETGVTIDSICGGETVEAVRLADGREIPCDAVLVAIGISPNSALAAASGLDCPNGVLANGQCQAGDNFYAIGDVAYAFNERYGRHMRLESWQNAEQQAEIASRHIVGESVRWNSVPWVWSDQFDWNLQTAGFPAKGNDIVARGSAADGKVLFFTLNHGKVCGATALGKGLRAAKDLRIAQMMIEADVRISPAALADEGTGLKKLLRAA